MIHVYGTSHVSEESMELIDRAIEEHDPDIVAVELDPLRLNSLLTGQKSSEGPIFLRIVKKFQDRIGTKTGVMPGEEMLYAYRKSIQEGREVALIDQDIRVTVNRLKAVSRKEKVRALVEVAAGFLVPGKFDVSNIPEEELIQELLDELQTRFPEMYRVLVRERDHVMADYLSQLHDEDREIVAFVGAAHRKSIEQILDRKIGSED